MRAVSRYKSVIYRSGRMMSQEQDAIFQLKGSMLAITLLELARYDLPRLERQLAEKVAQAPKFFDNTPLILALDKLQDASSSIDLQKLIDICRRHGLQTLAVRTDRPDDLTLASELGLPVIPPTSASGRALDPASQAQGEAARPSRIIHRPIRGGQQVYAQDCDLIVIGPVSPGAELLSDGNIHVYGPLRGRALAGIKGDGKARIFSQQLSAELVSIAGRYKVAEDLRRSPFWGQGVHISLTGDLLNINRL